MSTAHYALGLALADLHEQGVAPPCQGSHRDRWISEDPADREWAAHHCTGCPVLAECAAAADELRAEYVWGGTDRTKNQRTKKAS